MVGESAYHRPMDVISLVMTALVIEDHSRKCWLPRWPASIVFERACRYCSAQLALLTKLPSNLSIGSCRCSPSLTHFPGSTWTGWLDTKKSFFAEKSRIKIQALGAIETTRGWRSLRPTGSSSSRRTLRFHPMCSLW